MFMPLQNETFINQPPLVKNLKLQLSLPEVEGNIIAQVTQTRVRSVRHDTYPSAGFFNLEILGHGDTVQILDTGTGTR